MARERGVQRDSSFLIGLDEQMQMSRENALLGNYEASLVYFDGAISQIQRYLRTLDDPYLRSQWQKAKEDLSGEFRIVKEICLELAKFREPAGRAAASAALPAPLAGGWDAQPGQHHNPGPQGQYALDVGPGGNDRDPDVWSPPRAPQARRSSPVPAQQPDWARRDPPPRGAAAARGGGDAGDGPGAARGARGVAAGYGAAAAGEIPAAAARPNRRGGERKPPVPPRPKAAEKKQARFSDGVGPMDSELACMIEREILDQKPNVHWDDIAGPFLTLNSSLLT